MCIKEYIYTTTICQECALVLSILSQTFPLLHGHLIYWSSTDLCTMLYMLQIKFTTYWFTLEFFVSLLFPLFDFLFWIQEECTGLRDHCDGGPMFPSISVATNQNHHKLKSHWACEVLPSAGLEIHQIVTCTGW